MTPGGGLGIETLGDLFRAGAVVLDFDKRIFLIEPLHQAIHHRRLGGRVGQQFLLRLGAFDDLRHGLG